MTTILLVEDDKYQRLLYEQELRFEGYEIVTAGQIVDGLNVFYEDYRNRKIRIHNAIWLVVQQISGKHKEDMEKTIEYDRRNAN